MKYHTNLQAVVAVAGRALAMCIARMQPSQTGKQKKRRESREKVKKERRGQFAQRQKNAHPRR